jgi:hypothetical protein
MPMYIHVYLSLCMRAVCVHVHEPNADWLVQPNRFSTTRCVLVPLDHRHSVPTSKRPYLQFIKQEEEEETYYISCHFHIVERETSE